MLARSGPLSSRGDWAYEVKWDGFRAIVSTEGETLRVRSRRGWNMTDLVPELAALPISATLDGEPSIPIAQFAFRVVLVMSQFVAGATIAAACPASAPTKATSIGATASHGANFAHGSPTRDPFFGYADERT
jgi:ATP dependent DNA ligase domain